MPISKTDADATLDLLAGATSIRCICHQNPDGDTIGAMLGFGQLLEEQFPNANVSFHCVDPVPDTFRFLPAALRVTVVPPMADIGAKDVCVFFDSAEPKLTGLLGSHPELFSGSARTINIDHHPTNTAFGTINLIAPDTSSACEVIVQFTELLGWKLSPDAATCLLTGVFTDTGGLLHSNTTSPVYRTVALLLRAGARRQQVVDAVFRTAKLSTLRLWGRVLEKITLTEEGGAISAVTQGDFRATGANYSELTGAIDYVNAIPGMRFSLILSERDGKVKGSLRTLREDVDVSAMAGKFSGGGHRKAAGFSLSGHLKPEVRWKVVADDAAQETESSKA
ncbi:MAG: bifunctional oligoribonuclease/PAP phosphatase NrnA [Candidatus Peribacteraceae bacterium]|jgi:phosphoesterase RecJ-like protein